MASREARELLFRANSAGLRTEGVEVDIQRTHHGRHRLRASFTPGELSRSHPYRLRLPSPPVLGKEHAAQQQVAASLAGTYRSFMRSARQDGLLAPDFLASSSDGQDLLQARYYYTPQSVAVIFRSLVRTLTRLERNRCCIFIRALFPALLSLISLRRGIKDVIRTSKARHPVKLWACHGMIC